jgi:HNH endonuclease
MRATPEKYICACGNKKKRTASRCWTCYAADAAQRPAIDRFMEKLDTSGGLFACWPWRGVITNTGYGKFNLDGRMVLAHRVAYTLLVGPIGVGLEVCHACDNPPCCNPAHLWTGTPTDNRRDCLVKGRHGARYSRLTPEAIEAIRASDQPSEVLASQYGAGAAHVRRMQLGGYRRQTA